MGVHAAKAAALHRVWSDLQDQIAQLQQDRKEETDLITFVNQMITQCTDIEQKMADAITAMMELSLLFSNQADCYDKIAVSLDRMRTSTDLGALRSRKQFIQYQIKICTNKLKEVGPCFSSCTNYC
jgi:chaperonin cofactor prefoldin